MTRPRKNKGGRPSLDGTAGSAKIVRVRMTGPQIERLDEIARRLGLQRSEALRQLVANARIVERDRE